MWVQPLYTVWCADRANVVCHGVWIAATALQPILSIVMLHYHHHSGLVYCSPVSRGLANQSQTVHLCKSSWDTPCTWLFLEWTLGVICEIIPLSYCCWQERRLILNRSGLGWDELVLLSHFVLNSLFHVFSQAVDLANLVALGYLWFYIAIIMLW